MKRIFYLFIFPCFIFFHTSLSSQSKFNFYGNDKTKEEVRFRLINNLIVIPIEINNKPLSFILDTGVSKTILFNLTQNDSIGLNQVKTVRLQGLGTGKPVEALLSSNNRFRIRNFIGNNQALYFIFKDQFDFSSKMGTTIHGIIGHDLLKDVVTKIDYLNKRITFYNPQHFTFPKCRKCEIFPLEFHKDKPYVNLKVGVDTLSSKTTDVTMLIDSGGSDALWLFEYSKKDILTPKNHFNDILGLGLSGTIYGKRSRIPLLQIGRYKIPSPTVSFLDTISTKNARSFKKRNGSIGGNILKRFKVWLDYPNQQIMFKKSGSFSSGFNYNMTGIDIVYNGKTLVKEENKNVDKINFSNAKSTSDANTVSFARSYSYKFKPAYRVSAVVSDSPAHIAGVKKNDILISINGRSVHQYSLSEIYQRFQEGDKQKITITIERLGVKMKFKFRLRKRV